MTERKRGNSLLEATARRDNPQLAHPT